MDGPVSFLLALVLSTAITAIAVRRRSLSTSGAVAAIPLGTTILGLGGWHWGVPLFVFFVTASILSKLSHRHKATTAAVFAKGSCRDWAQVLANGGLGLLLVLLAHAFPDPRWYAAYLGVIATATADTWATEVGTLGNSQPRAVNTLRPVPPGTSGGVSIPGTLAAAAGALLIGALGFIYYPAPGLIAITAFAGTTGMLIDSLMGATVQARYHCECCDRQVEAATHCGTAARHDTGIHFVNNDVVNLAATAAGGLIAALLHP